MPWFISRRRADYDESHLWSMMGLVLTSNVNFLDAMFPVLGRAVGRTRLAKLPTPVQRSSFVRNGKSREISIKLDNLSGDLYGGNKVRKLEYLLRPMTRKAIQRFATFGTVGSNHALATAIYARELGFECSCFLMHQRWVSTIAPALLMHAKIGTEIVRFGGDYSARVKILRENLWGRRAWVVPMGGSSWIGTLGFVNAGLELATQIRAGELPVPQDLYVATGTMGTAAGLGLGLALAGLPTEVHAVRVSDTRICNEGLLHRLIRKTALMMHHLDFAVPEDLAQRVKIRLRHSQFAGGYAHSNAQVEAAIGAADEHFGLVLEPTYTGKAMAALLGDLMQNDRHGESLFWNSYNSVALPDADDGATDLAAIPVEFRRYLRA
jgi:D-cysteine desulfhydrase